MNPWSLRIVVVSIVLAIVAVGAIPLVILLDLTNGGTGWGLCEDGLGSCRVGAFSGLRLGGILVVVIFMLLAFLRAIVFIAGRLSHPQDLDPTDVWIR